jgi:hypothetical protein
MRRLIWTVPAVAAIATATQFLPPGSAQAAGVDLGTNGSVVAGVRATQHVGEEVAFQFTVTNHSSSKAEVFLTFTVTGSADPANYICPVIGTGLDISTDGDICEPGWLAGGKSTQLAAVVKVTGDSGQISVRVCAASDSTAGDPNRSNDCKTLHVPNP